MLNLITPVLALENVNLGPGDSFTGLSEVTITDMISGGITLILIVAAVIFFFMLIFGGIKWIMSGGDKANTESARNTVTSALIGLVIVFSAWAIAQLIGHLFNVEILGDSGITLPKFYGGE
jgi:Na+/proline symporter